MGHRPDAHGRDRCRPGLQRHRSRPWSRLHLPRRAVSQGRPQGADGPAQLPLPGLLLQSRRGGGRRRRLRTRDALRLRGRGRHGGPGLGRRDGLPAPGREQLRSSDASGDLPGRPVTERDLHAHDRGLPREYRDRSLTDVRASARRGGRWRRARRRRRRGRLSGGGGRRGQRRGTHAPRSPLFRQAPRARDLSAPSLRSACRLRQHDVLRLFGAAG